MNDHFLGIDVGGTTIKAVVLDDLGRPVFSRAEATDIPGILQQVLAIGSAIVRDDPQIKGIGLLAPGVVDTSTGRLVYAANLDARDVDMESPLSEATGLPVKLDHDGRAAGLAEGILGAASKAETYVVVPIGTGISASLTLGGNQWAGHTFGAGELGHTPIFPGGETCSCGQKGCLEVYASAEGISRRYQKATGKKADAAHVEALMLAENPDAVRIWGDATQALALACAHLTLLLDPQRIVFAGGLSNAGEHLLLPVASNLRGLLQWREPPELALSTLGAQAGQLGAAILGAQAAGKDCYMNWSVS